MALKKISLSKKKLALIIVAILLLAGGGYWLYQKNHESKPLGIGEVNYGPPTKAEKRETEEHKKQLEEDQNNNNASANSNQANVVITYLSPTEARGYVSNVLEDGGTCTITLTKGSSKVTASSTGAMDVNKTTCGPMMINQGQLNSGSWTAVLSYSSSKASGSSAPQKLSVP